MSGADELDLLIEQSQQLCQVYDDRRKDADTSAAGLLTASVGLVTLAITGTAIASASTLGKAVAVAVTIAGAVSGILAVIARSVSGLRPVPAITLTGNEIYVVKPLPPGRAWRFVSYLTRRARRSQMAELCPPSLLSHESTAFRTAHARLDALGPTRDGEPQHEVLALWRAREGDLHYIAQHKERMVAYSGVVLSLATVLVAITGLFVLWK